MDLIRIFRCDDANAYLIIGLLLGGLAGELIYLIGARIRIRRLWFLAGMTIGVLAGAAVYWSLNINCR